MPPAGRYRPEWRRTGDNGVGLLAVAVSVLLAAAVSVFSERRYALRSKQRRRSRRLAAAGPRPYGDSRFCIMRSRDGCWNMSHAI